MSFPDAFAPDMVLGPDQVLPTVPRDFGERFTLNWKAARAPDKSYFYETRMSELWEDALEKLRAATGQTFANPFTLAPAQSVGKYSPAGVALDVLQRTLFGDRQKGIEAALAAFDQARAGQFDLPDPRRFEDTVRGEATKLRQDAERSALASYGAGGLGAFLGAAAGEMSHPINVATLPVGGTYAAANIARVGLLRFLGRNALAEAGVAAASQAAIEAADAPIQERLATDTGLGDRLERVLIAAAGGAALGLGLSGLVAAVRGVRRGARMTLDEADALKVAERASYAERNPLGPDGANAHARALDTAEVAVSEGRHADVREVVEQEVRQQITAYHGSGARFEKFNPDKIGEGEGTHAGHGLYFAERRDVADSYVMPGGALYEVRLNASKADFIDADAPLSGQAATVKAAVEAVSRDLGVEPPSASMKMGEWLNRAEAAVGDQKAVSDALLAKGIPGAKSLDVMAREMGGDTRNYVVFDHRLVDIVHRADEPLDILDSAAATRPIADAAPVPPEKPPTGMKEAKADEARAMVLQKDFEITMEDGTKRLASEVMAEADERVKAAKLAAECAAGGAIG